MNYPFGKGMLVIMHARGGLSLCYLRDYEIDGMNPFLNTLQIHLDFIYPTHIVKWLQDEPILK